jgi:amidase
MALETINLVFGRSLNPYNRTLHPGASSGGEGALLAMRGSAIGLGSDYGGSIRGPATFCGLYGIRPSWGRLSYQDASNALEGLETRRSCAGPMGNSPEDLGLLMSSYMAAKPWTYDQEVLDMPWKGDVMPAGPLCFAIIYGDEDVSLAFFIPKLQS